MLCTSTKLDKLIPVSFILQPIYQYPPEMDQEVIFWTVYTYVYVVGESLHDEMRPCFLKLLILASRHVGNYVNIIHVN